MKYPIGERVQVKSFEEIRKTLDKTNHLKGEVIFFNDGMKVHCGKTYEIDSYASTGPYYQLASCESEPGAFWKWPEDWIKPVVRFKVGDLVVVRPDLVPGKVYGNEIFIDCMLPTKGTVVKIESVDSITGFYSVRENLWNYSDKMFLTLEEAFIPGRKVCKKNGTTFSNGSKIVTVSELTNSRAWFQETDSYLSILELRILPEVYSPTEKITTTTLDYSDLVDSIKSNVIYSNWFNPIKNTKDYENQLQREKTRIRGAEVPEGSRICSRKRKAAIIFGHLSNQARTGF